VAEVNIPVTFTYNGVTRTANVHVVRQNDPPTTAGSGGTDSDSTTTLGTTTGTTYETTNAVSATLTVTAGPAGQVACAASIGFKRTPGTSAGETGAYGKWQWRVPAGSWADIATEVVADQDSVTTVSDITRTTWGNLAVSQTKTGLTASTDYEFRFLWRRVDVADDADDIYCASGSMTATAS
jgi:hypothetical protein